MEMSSDQIKTLRKNHYFEVHYKAAEAAASASSCRQHTTELGPRTPWVKQAEAQDP